MGMTDTSRWFRLTFGSPVPAARPAGRPARGTIADDDYDTPEPRAGRLRAARHLVHPAYAV